MPIIPHQPIKRISEKDFHELDYEIMKLAFATHNDLGRFYDEEIYQSELLRRCNDSGIEKTREFEVQLTHADFIKPLFIDLLMNNSTVYELKAAKALSAPNRIQTLNYLFATDTQHGKLVNFRPKSVEHEFVSTQLDYKKRQQFNLSENNGEAGSKAQELKYLTVDLLNDWGAFFDTDIYMDALCHFLGGKEYVIRDVAISAENTRIGSQKIPHLTPSAAFCLSSVTKNIPAYRNHLIRFLKHTPLDALHWINLNHSCITLSSLKKESFCP